MNLLTRWNSQSLKAVSVDRRAGFRVTATLRGERVVVDVADSGPGFDLTAISHDSMDLLALKALGGVLP